MGPDHIFHLEKDQIIFTIEPQLGGGTFATAIKCKFLDDNFPEEVYVVKVIHSGNREVPLDPSTIAMETRLTVTHHGTVNPFDMFRVFIWHRAPM